MARSMFRKGRTTGVKRFHGQEGDFPMIGKLKKGEPKGEKRPGRELPYFRFASSNPGYTAAWNEAFTEPQELRVFMPHKTPTENFAVWNEEWNLKRELVRRCEGPGISEDGETVYGSIVVEGLPDGSRDYTDKPCLLSTGKKCNCKEKGRLRMFIPELNALGYVMLETTSKVDNSNFFNTLNAVYDLTNDLRGIPFILRRYQAEMAYTDDKGARRTGTHWFVALEVDPANTRVEHLISAFGNDEQVHALLSGQPVRQIEGPTSAPAAAVRQIEAVDYEYGEYDEEDVDEEEVVYIDPEREQLVADCDALGIELFFNDGRLNDDTKLKRWHAKADEQAAKKYGKGTKYADLTIEQLEAMRSGLQTLQEKREAESGENLQAAPANGDSEASDESKKTPVANKGVPDEDEVPPF